MILFARYKKKLFLSGYYPYETLSKMMIKENARILVLFAHPLLEKSRANKMLLKGYQGKPHITFHDLYEAYPEFNIDIRYEKNLLEEHSLIIWHHPFYWYSSPPLLKQWIDMVLEVGWAYGPGAGFAGKIYFTGNHHGRRRTSISE